jgi:hypothetical protein
MEREGDIYSKPPRPPISVFRNGGTIGGLWPFHPYLFLRQPIQIIHQLVNLGLEGACICRRSGALGYLRPDMSHCGASQSQLMRRQGAGREWFCGDMSGLVFYNPYLFLYLPSNAERSIATLAGCRSPCDSGGVCD